MYAFEAHSHSFAASAWPFQEPVNTVAYASSHVLDGQPILVVVHDHEGDWQFLAGPEGGECHPTCLGCAYERDDSIAILADLPAGWIAFRQSVGEPWQGEPYDDGGADEAAEDDEAVGD